MTSGTTPGFREALSRLPDAVRSQAARAYGLWRTDPYHPSLQFKRVSQRQPIYSVRVGLGHRALGLWERDRIECSGSELTPITTASFSDSDD